jgi:hypothetical protein
VSFPRRQGTELGDQSGEEPLAKKLIDEAIKKGCPIPPGAWKAATTGIPQSPRGR